MGDRARATEPHTSLADDRPEEACGVFGIYAPGQDVSRLTYFGLHALQHRGQESAGIAVADGESTVVFKDMGLVPQIFDESKLAALQGHVAVGHVRYSTTGSTRWENAQPILKVTDNGTLALVHNGNLLNSKALRDEIMTNGHKLRSTSDSELIAEAVAARKGESIESAVAATMGRLHGAYSLLIMTETQLIAIRDQYGVRPLSIGRLGDDWVIASETCALDIVGAEYERDVRPGEKVLRDGKGKGEERQCACRQCPQVPVAPAADCDCVGGTAYPCKGRNEQAASAQGQQQRPGHDESVGAQQHVPFRPPTRCSSRRRVPICPWKRSH